VLAAAVVAAAGCAAAPCCAKLKSGAGAAAGSGSGAAAAGAAAASAAAGPGPAGCPQLLPGKGVWPGVGPGVPRRSTGAGAGVAPAAPAPMPASAPAAAPAPAAAAGAGDGVLKMPAKGLLPPIWWSGVAAVVDAGETAGRRPRGGGAAPKPGDMLAGGLGWVAAEAGEGVWLAYRQYTGVMKGSVTSCTINGGDASYYAYMHFMYMIRA
jgi:hypothetical protein